MKNAITALVGMVLVWFAASGAFANPNNGLNEQALSELDDADVFKYLGDFEPVSSTNVGDGWTKHQFDPDGGNGPICIAGTSYSAFTRAGKSNKLLIVEQGGGACWQDSYNCNILSESQEPPTARVGIWDFDSKENPFRDYSIVYMPYCDGSVHSGDNDVFDPAWQAFFEQLAGLPQGTGPLVRFHRGLRNQSAGMDIAKAVFPNAKKVTVTGSSAGGVGAAGFAPFLVRKLFGNDVDLTVINDAGPAAINLSAAEDIAARAADWQLGQFYPASCTNCDDMSQPTAIIDWRLSNDSSIREGFYSTDGDLTNRFFLDLLPPNGTQEDYRLLLLTEHHDKLHADYPKRYKNFIVSGDSSHTALQAPLFYSQEVDGIPLNEWTRSLIEPGKKSWRELVEEFIPL